MTEQRPIVLAYDGSEPAQAAIREAGHLFPGRRALVVTSWQVPLSAMPSVVGGIPAPAFSAGAEEEIEGAARGRAQAIADHGARLAQEAGFGSSDGHAEQAHGPIWQALLAFADAADADVLVVGARGLSHIKGVLLGSVSSAVLQHATRAVLVLRGGG